MLDAHAEGLGRHHVLEHARLGVSLALGEPDLRFCAHLRPLLFPARVVDLVGIVGLVPGDAVAEPDVLGEGVFGVGLVPRVFRHLQGGFPLSSEFGPEVGPRTHIAISGDQRDDRGLARYIARESNRELGRSPEVLSLRRIVFWSRGSSVGLGELEAVDSRKDCPSCPPAALLIGVKRLEVVVVRAIVRVFLPDI